MNAPHRLAGTLRGLLAAGGVRRAGVLALMLAALPGPVQAGPDGGACGAEGVAVQVLGSGGPEVAQTGRASASYLVRVDGRARVLVDAGAGSALNFARSGAAWEELDVVVLTHLHVDHSADLPALVKASWFGHRQRDLPLFGPGGNALMPSTREFVAALFGEPGGAFRYLSDFLQASPAGGYRLLARDVDATGTAIRTVPAEPGLRLSAVPVHHGPVPALAWRIDVAGHAITFSGDMNGDYGTLPALAMDSDLLVAHFAIPEGTRGVARRLHMPPSVIGRIAAAARVGRLVLSHRMRRTLGREAEALRAIRRSYRGPVAFADDLDCFRP